MARSGVCQHCHREMLPRQITQSALLKNNDRGNKKALIGNTNQGFNALEGSKKI